MAFRPCGGRCAGPADLAPGTWNTTTIDLTPYTGQTIRLLVETADTGRDSLLEAGLDDINITQN
jgi:hypothetical protein